MRCEYCRWFRYEGTPHEETGACHVEPIMVSVRCNHYCSHWAPQYDYDKLATEAVKLHIERLETMMNTRLVDYVIAIGRGRIGQEIWL